MHDELCDAKISQHVKRKAVLHNLKYYLNLFFKVVVFFRFTLDFAHKNMFTAKLKQ